VEDREAEYDIAGFWRDLVAHDGDLSGTLGVITAWAAEVVGEGSVLMLLSDSGQTMQLAAVYHTDPKIESLNARDPGSSSVPRG
jgi:hypothetical protein